MSGTVIIALLSVSCASIAYKDWSRVQCLCHTRGGGGTATHALRIVMHLDQEMQLLIRTSVFLWSFILCFLLFA